MESLTTIELSTSIPSTIMSEAREIKCICTLNTDIIMKVMNIITGIAMETIKPFLRFIPIIITIITITIASIRLTMKLFISSRTSSDWKYTSRIFMLSESVFSNSLTTPFTSSAFETTFRSSLKYSETRILF